MGLIAKPMRMSLYREKSLTTKTLCEAMCQASLKFSPLHFDSTGKDEDGREYRYASLAAIKKATSRALSEAGVWIHSDYGFDDRGRWICVTIEKDDEWITSYLDIPEATSHRKRKALMTQLRRAAVEGLLDLAAEQDTDADGVEDVPSAQVVDAAKPAAWADMKRMAKDAIAIAANQKTIEAKVAKAREKVEAGEMDPADLPELVKFAEQRLKDLGAALAAAGLQPAATGGGK